MPLRIVTAAAIFDGHDVAIGIFRRILQSQGCEVIHLGHDRGADEVARAAIQEDAHAIAITSYQGGAVEMFTHTKEILDESGFGHVFLFGGGGGTTSLCSGDCASGRYALASTAAGPSADDCWACDAGR